MSNIDKQALREELSNPAICSNAHLRKLALALLDELEAAKQDAAKWFMSFEKVVSVGARYEERIEELTGKLEAAEKRIAELEARDKPKSVQCWSCKHDIEILAIADCDGYCPRCAAPIDLDDEPYAAAGKGE